MSDVLAGKAVVITGSGRGLGRAFADGVVAAGARVVVSDVDGDVVDIAVAEITAAGGTAVGFTGSVASWDDAEALIGTCADAFGGVDGVVNNAGFFYRASPLEETEADLRQIVEVNVLGSMFVGVHAIRAMSAMGGGSLVNIASEGMMGYAGMGAYAATKGGVASLTFAWSRHLDETGVRINAVAPNAQTRMSPVDADGIPLPRPQAGTVAPVVVYLLSDRSAALNGKILKFNGTTLTPIVPPSVSTEGITRDTWTAEEIADACAGELAPVLEAASGPSTHSAAR